MGTLWNTIVEDAIEVGVAAPAGTAVTKPRVSTNTRAKKILNIFLFKLFLLSLDFYAIGLSLLPSFSIDTTSLHIIRGGLFINANYQW